MSTAVVIRDETPGGETRQWTLELLSERLTVAELIRSRIYQEVKDHNVRQNATYHGLVQPKGTEPTGRGFRLKKPRQIDWKEQYELALEAFRKNQILVLIDDHQAESLDEEVQLRPGSEVTFLKLVPLVGG